MDDATNVVKVFLSHASIDAHFATILAEHIEAAFEHHVEVFLTSRPDALKSATSWRKEIFAKLDAADLLLVLLTSSSEVSAWVNFETGYFWHKHGGEHIHILRHPKARMPGTVTEVQAKLVTDESELRSFFDTLEGVLNIKSNSDVQAIARVAISAASRDIQPPIPERSLRYFETMLDIPSWEHLTVERLATIGEVADLLSHGVEYDVATNNEVWICPEDANLQIIRDYGTEDEFEEVWLGQFPTYHAVPRGTFARKYSVYLSIAGIRVKELIFISLDGGNYFVPQPETRNLNKDIGGGGRDFRVMYFWKLDSLEVKIAKIIGSFYYYQSLEELAAELEIALE